MKRILPFFLLPVFGYAAPGKPVTITGSLKTTDPVKMIYLSYRVGDERHTDSTTVKNGQFSFTANLEEPTLATLSAKFQKHINSDETRTERKMLFLEPGTIKVKVKDSLQLATVTGSTAHAEYEKLNELEKPYDAAMNALNEPYRKCSEAKDEAGMKRIVAQADSITKEKDEKVSLPYLLNHQNSPIALYVLREYAGYDLDPAKVEPLFETLPAATRQLPSGIEFKGRIETAKKTAVGAYALDFTQNDTLDQPVSLSSFKGKYVLLDFWASWCGPCRRENPNVVKAYEKYKDKQFTVLGVSLDQPGKKDAWLKAIHQDGLTWTHVSDLKFWNNEVAKLYGIQAIPQNLLLDPQGKIVAKNIRGEELQQKLAELLP
ncbi:TlpA disulfide reductase family protein [Flavihumibacter petaseus]|uniref:Putative thiol-disulfide oxidoreductase n=1 Tax=Flavihumibacter petaseus NBRC 106054 TaxID=1220578 RepID=A0A0E9MZP9_9BACT|nr:TlpA disulfide reductase family protein [Flavihumibacter petaseus]GAO43008.1 putative thiol-disulfide oxidoreductase [Flavihumibacter petaseus NBRC 106054]